MHLNPYGQYAVQLACSLANDWPATRAGIVTRTRHYGMTMAFPEKTDDRSRCREVLDDWLLIVDTDEDDKRAALLNRQMANATAYPRLTDHNGEGWHLHFRDVDDDLPRVLQAVFSVGTALHLTTRGMVRLGRCASNPCINVIVDTSRNGTQRYCSPRCASRDAVRRHRSRRQLP